MKRLTVALLGATGCLLLSSGSGLANSTSWIYDYKLVGTDGTFSHVKASNGTYTENGFNVWGDTIGASNGFNSGAIKVEYIGADSIKITAFTDYGATYPNVGIADMFFDLGNDGTASNPDWDYGFDFNSTGSGQRPSNGQLVDLSANGITISTAYNAEQAGFFNGIYGRWTDVCDSSVTGDCGTDARESETRILGNTTYDTAVTVDSSGTTLVGPDGSDTYTYAYSFTLTGLDFADGWNNMRIFWGTGFCANDTIEGVVRIPVPAALPIIGAALAGFGFAGWRQRKPA